MLVRWPAGGVAGGSKLEAPTSQMDIMPTLLEVVGSKSKGLELDGVSVLGKVKMADDVLVFLRAVARAHHSRTVFPRTLLAVAHPMFHFFLIAGTFMVEAGLFKRQMASSRPLQSNRETINLSQM